MSSKEASSHMSWSADICQQSKRPSIGSRRVACKACRDRKVRCDGDQPCQRCHRSGENCVYSSAFNPTKADLMQTIEVLRDRVDTAEAYIKQGGLFKLGQNHDSVDYGEFSRFNVQMAPTTDPGDSFLLATSHSLDTTLVQFPDTSETDFLGSLSRPRSSTQDHPGDFTVDNIMSLEGMSSSNDSSNGTNGTNGNSDSNGTNSSQYNSPARTNSNSPVCSMHNQQRADQHGLSSSPRARIPSLQEIRALTSPSAVFLSSPPLFSDMKLEDSRRITNEFTTFCSTIFTVHAEIAGVAGAIGEYLAWFRKSLAMVGLDPNCAALLQTLEERIWEVKEMAETRPPEAWAGLLDTLKKDALDEHLLATMSSFEVEAQERVEETRNFFQQSYDVSSRLQEQLQGSHKE